ncbi:MAG: hypothetical protein ACTSUN_09780, partial [Promethearchaeota archaeon]
MRKGIIIKNLKPIKKHFEEFPIFIPQPKTISFLDENMGSMINSECYISPVNIDQEYCKFLLEEINDFLKANSSFQVKFAPLSAEDKKNLEKQENDFQFQE